MYSLDEDYNRRRTTTLMDSEVIQDIHVSRPKIATHHDYSITDKNSTLDVLNRTRQIDKMFQDSSRLDKWETYVRRRVYPSDSAYAGSWKSRSWEGHGIYTYPHGVKFYGNFVDSQRNGHGYIEYPMGQRLKGLWNNDKLISWTYRFNDGVEYVEPWNYCMFPDRRYTTSRRDGFRPPGEERITPHMPPREIPAGCYDVGEGFYNPKTRCIISAVDLNKIIRIPNPEEEQWIVDNCRKAWDAPVGFRPGLYEYWTNGTAAETATIEADILTREIVGE